MAEQEIKQCPFCGGNIIFVGNDEICCPVEYEAYAQCMDCDAQGPGAYRFGTREEAIEEAIRLWNGRLVASGAEIG